MYFRTSFQSLTIWTVGRSVQIDPFWFEAYRLRGNLPTIEQQRILAGIQSRLEIRPPQGSNRVIIAHSFPRGVGLGQIPNMGTVIINPLGRGNGYEFVSRLSLRDLMTLLS